MRLVRHNKIPMDESLARAWNDLVRQMERPEVFYTYEWAVAVYRAYGSAFMPCLFLAYEESLLIGVVALAIDVKQKEILFLTGSTADYCDFLSAPGRRQEFVASVLSELRKSACHKLVLASVPADSATAAAFRSLHRQGYFAFVRPAYSCAQVSILDSGQRTDAEESARRRLRRFQKSIGQPEQIRVKHAKSDSAIRDALPDFVAAHVSRFLLTGRLSNLIHAARRSFLTELSRLLSPSGSVLLSRLMLGERTIAWNFGFLFAGSWFWYQPTFDSEFQLYSPGIWLLSAILNEACAAPEIKRVDLGLGAEGYKERLANDCRETLHITVTKSPFLYLRVALRHYGAKAVKSFPQVEAGIRAGLKSARLMHAALLGGHIAEYCTSTWRHLRQNWNRPHLFLFLEWVANDQASPAMVARERVTLKPIDLNLLAEAAMHYEEDSGTLRYLIGAAQRLMADPKGIALMGASGIPIYFCWTKDFSSQVGPLSEKVNDEIAEGILIVDGWTPASAEENADEEKSLFAVASQLSAQGKRAWTVAECGDGSSLRQAQKAGFVLRFSANRKDDLVRHIFRVSQSTKSAGAVKAPSAA